MNAQILLFLTVNCLLLKTIKNNPVNDYNNNDNNSGDRLEKIVMIHRHGDRTPLSTYPNDPYRDPSYWPDGWGQLTQVRIFRS